MYIKIFIFVISFILAYLSGFLVSLRTIYHDGHEIKGKGKKKAHRGIKRRARAVIKKSINDKFSDKGDCFSDLICDVTKEDESSYISERRKRQTESYNYTKQKNKNYTN